jgi:23S rRNA (cytidine1920-2'-O)/16S rRNA (cytidine1409-2'-O)-methyltransferase
MAYQFLVDRGAAATEKHAKTLVMEGRVYIDGIKIVKPGDLVSGEGGLEVRQNRLYVSRGGLKLEGVFGDLGLDAAGKTAIDIGASTGGFTDFLIRNGALHVTAVDVGKGLLSWELRNNNKVRVLEKTNIRYLDLDMLDRKYDLVTADLSFISIKKVFNKILDVSSSDAEILLLVKPQFELERELVKHKGVVKEKGYHKKVLKDMLKYLENFEVIIEGLAFSRIRGSAGNIEFWIYLRKSIISTKSNINYDKIIIDVVERAHKFFNIK